MARRGFNPLRAALGAVTGVAEGLQQRDLLAEKRRKDAEEAMLRRIEAGLVPVEDILPQEQGRVGPLASAPLGQPPMSGMASPASFGQYLAQRTQAPAGGAGPTAPSPFGMGPAPERPASNVERVMQEFQGRAPRTVRIGEQRYAMQPTAQENSLMSIALQQAMQRDAKATEAETLANRAKSLAKVMKVPVETAEAILGGVDAGMLGVETATPLQRRVSEANIRQSNAAAAASSAAAELARSGGKKRTPEEIMDNVTNAIARFATTRDEETGKMPDMEQVKAFGKTLKSMVNVPMALEEEFDSPPELAKIAQLRQQQYSDEEIRGALRRAKAKAPR